MSLLSFLFIFTATPPTHLYTLSLHDALPISAARAGPGGPRRCRAGGGARHLVRSGRVAGRGVGRLLRHQPRSEEHTSELQSHVNLVCRLLLEKKKKNVGRGDVGDREAGVGTH